MGGKSVRLVAVYGHNLTAGATWTVLNGTTVIATGNAWPDGVVNALYPGLIFCWLSSAETVSGSIVLEIDDSSNPAGYIDLGRLWIGGDGFQPGAGRNFKYGDRLDWEDPATVTESAGGAEYFSSLAKPRRIERLTMADLNDAEALTVSQATGRGIARQVFYCRDPAAAGDTLLHHTFLARQRALSALETIALGLNSSALELREVNA
jgi:hypothetical protein